MKPKCKLCGSAHWTWEEHTLKGTEELQRVGASVLRKSVTKRNNVTEPLTNNVTPITESAAHVKKAVPKDGSAQPLVHPGRPKKHKTNAERQRAYRERSG